MLLVAQSDSVYSDFGTEYLIKHYYLVTPKALYIQYNLPQMVSHYLSLHVKSWDKLSVHIVIMESKPESYILVTEAHFIQLCFAICPQNKRSYIFIAKTLNANLWIAENGIVRDI